MIAAGSVSSGPWPGASSARSRRRNRASDSRYSPMSPSGGRITGETVPRMWSPL